MTAASETPVLDIARNALEQDDAFVRCVASAMACVHFDVSDDAIRQRIASHLWDIAAVAFQIGRTRGVEDVLAELQKGKP